jgi:hypothetical protein
VHTVQSFQTLFVPGLGLEPALPKKQWNNTFFIYFCHRKCITIYNAPKVSLKPKTLVSLNKNVFIEHPKDLNQEKNVKLHCFFK